MITFLVLTHSSSLSKVFCTVHSKRGFSVRTAKSLYPSFLTGGVKSSHLPVSLETRVVISSPAEARAVPFARGDTGFTAVPGDGTAGVAPPGTRWAKAKKATRDKQTATNGNGLVIGTCNQLTIFSTTGQKALRAKRISPKFPRFFVNMRHNI